MPRRKSVEQIDKELSDLKRQRREAVRRESMAARKARDHATYVAGGLLLSCFSDGWQSVDWERLASLIDHNKEVFAKQTAKTLPWDEANARLRKWEREQRNAQHEGETESRDHAGKKPTGEGQGGSR